MNLIIVESPTKARTLTRYLKGSYRVEATMGHIRDLPASRLGVDVDHDFVPEYVIASEKKKRVEDLKKIAGESANIILATDPDREGEAIAWHVAQLLGKWEVGNGKLDKEVRNEKKGSKKSKHKDISLQHPASNFPSLTSGFQRIVFHEITESAIREALDHPQQIDQKLVNAQQARRVLDRLVGYKLSPVLWTKLSKRWLSAGRVQSVAVRLIVERERERDAFRKESYWTIDGDFGFIARLISKDGQKYEQSITLRLFDGPYTYTKTSIASEEQAKTIIGDVQPPYIVSAVEKKEIKRAPPPPFTTSTVQQEAGRRLYFSSKRTMQLAQKLYEEGYITYHRTDSVALSEKFLTEARAYITDSFGKEYLPGSARLFKTKSKVAQEAHEAIRPTDVTVHGSQFTVHSEELNRDHARLYELIWKRAVACQAAEAVFDSTTIDVSSANGYLFETQGSVVTFDGFLKITGRENGDTEIPLLSVGDTVGMRSVASVAHESAPPPRYTEASLVKSLEASDIGRPSTYAPIISTIQERQYVTKIEKQLAPTDLGFAVTDFLVRYFSRIMSLPFTADMEGTLDRIASGDIDWVTVVRTFYTPFAALITKTMAEAGKVKVAEEAIDEVCPDCGNPLVIRMGRFGKFIACTTFPTCRYTRQLVEKIDMKCPVCNGDIVVKKTRKGKTFYGCANWPKCTFAAWKKEDIIHPREERVGS